MGEVGGGRATNSARERVGVGRAGMDHRAPNCLRKDGVGGGECRRAGGRGLRHLLT